MEAGGPGETQAIRGSRKACPNKQTEKKGVCGRVIAWYVSELRRAENQMWSLICGVQNKCDKLMERGNDTTLAWRGEMPLFQGKWHHWTLHESSIWNYSGRLWSYRVVHFVTQTSMIYFEITNIFQGLKVTPSSGSQLVTYRYPHGPIMESFMQQRQ